MKVFAGIDIGTQGTKAALFNDSGVLLASALRQSALHQPAPGIVEENAERQVATVCQTLRECVDKSRIRGTQVAAIAISGQMAGVIGIGDRGEAVTPYDSWLDTRCAPYNPADG